MPHFVQTYYCVVIFFVLLGCRDRSADSSGSVLSDSSGVENVNSPVTVTRDSSLLTDNRVGFDHYTEIKNTDFLQFVNLFEKKSLPISTDDMISIDIWHLDKTPLSQDLIDRYLFDGGELITGPLYSYEPDEGIPAKDVIGVFYPLYKLPTNGDYVLLTIAQVDHDPVSECQGLVVTLSYDLNGNFLYLINYTYRPGTDNINAYIDQNLKSHVVYVYHEVNGEPVFPPMDSVFSAQEARKVDQIGSNGKSSEILFEMTPGQFKFDHNECRFKRVN